MNKIKSAVRVLMLDSLSDSIVRIYKDQVAKDPSGRLARDENLAEMMAGIEGLSEEITVAIKRDKIQKNLSDLDLARDQVIGQIFAMITGYVANPDEQKQKAAQKLTDVTSKYKSIRSENFAAKSALIESMLRDFAADSPAEAILLLDGLGQRIDELRAAQEAFYKEKDQINVQKMNQGNPASSIKKPLLTVLNEKLIPYLSALQSSESYQNFAYLCENEINEINATASRKKASEGEKSEAESVDPKQN